MAGKNTSKSEHESRVGNIVAEYSLPENIKNSLSILLGQHIDENQQFLIEDLISNYRYIGNTSVNVKSQDIKRTLNAMSKLSEVEANAAYKKCDTYTEAHILREIYLMDKEGIKPCIHQAILRANTKANSKEFMGGRPTKNYIKYFVVECLRMWVSWSGKPITHTYIDGHEYASDTLEWCQKLIHLVIDESYDYRELARIISNNKGKVFPVI